MARNDGNEQNPLQRALALHYEQLSRSQRLVVEHLLGDLRYAAVVSAPELAQQVGVSESTVTRAAQTLGFAGYPDMQARVRQQFFTPLSDRVEAGLLQLGDTLETAAIQAILEDADSVRKTAEDLVPETLRQAVELLVNAERVFIFGSRGSYGLAQMLSIGLRLLLGDARLLGEEAGLLADQLTTVTSADALVVISFRRVDRITVGAVSHGARIGASTIAISDVLHSPVARLADVALTARSGPLRLMPSYAPGASLINALITAVSHRTLDNATDRLDMAERLWADFAVHIEDD